MNLKPAQQEKVAAVFKEYGNLLLTAINENVDAVEFPAPKHEIFQEMDVKIRKVLTDEQIELYQQSKSQLYRGRFQRL